MCFGKKNNNGKLYTDLDKNILNFAFSGTKIRRREGNDFPFGMRWKPEVPH